MMNEKAIRWQLNKDETDYVREQLNKDLRQSFINILRWPAVLTLVAPVLYFAANIWQGIDQAVIVGPTIALFAIGIAICAAIALVWVLSTYRQRAANRKQQYIVEFTPSTITIGGIKVGLVIWTKSVDVIDNGGKAMLQLEFARTGSSKQYKYFYKHVYRLPVPNIHFGEIDSIIDLCGLVLVNDYRNTR